MNLRSQKTTKSPCLTSKNARGGHLVFQNEAKNIPRQDFMVMNISCKFEKASYNIIFVRAVKVKSLYTLRRRRRHNKVKSIASSYPVDTMTAFISKPKMAKLWFRCFEYYPCIQKWQYIQ